LRDESTARPAQGTHVNHRDDQFFLLTESSPDAIFIGTEGRFAYVNPAARRLFGAHSPEQLLGQPVIERIHPDHRGVVAERIRRLDEDGENAPLLEEIYLRLDGTPVEVEVSAVPFRYAGTDGALVFVRDISSRKRAEKDLLASETRFRQMFEHNDAVMLLIEPQSGAIEDANAAASRFYGYSIDTLRSMKIDQINLLSPEQVAAERARAARQECNYFVFPHRLASGDVRLVEVHVSLFAAGERLLLLSIIHDVTARRQAEIELERNQQLLRSIIDNSAAVIFVKDLHGRYLMVNRRYSELFHVSDEEMRGRSDHDLFAADVADAVLAADRQVLSSGAAQEFEEVVPQEDGPHTYLALKFPLFDSGGHPYAVCGIATDISERKGAEAEILALNQSLEQRVDARTRELTQAVEALAEREREFRGLANNVPDNIVRYSLDGRLLYLNRTLERTLGVSAADVVGKTAREIAPDGRYDALAAAVLQVGASGDNVELEQVVPGPDGKPRYHLIRIVAEPGPDGRPASVLAVGRDLTEQKLAEEELRLAASVFHNSAEGVLVTDASGCIVSVNPAFTDITGYSEAEAIGKKPSLLRSDRQGVEFYRAMWHALTHDGRWQGEIWNRKKSGEAYLEWLTINRIDDSVGTPVRYVSVFHDITEMRRKDERIHHLAFHDALTGLPNRTLIHDRLQHALDRAQRQQGRLSVTFIDLDRFKGVNDALGHDIGDLLLQEVARRIQGRLRAADTVARLGGDEFVVLMEELGEAEHCASLAQELIAVIAQPMQLRGYTVEIGASLGTAFYPEDGSDPLELMKRADTAMYAAKAAGRNTYRFFQQEMLDRTSQRLTLEMDLRRAIANHDLELHYQPRVALATTEPQGVEALVRWRHPIRGLLPPNEFIPLAEESGLILDVGAWVLNEACRQAAAWQAGGRSVRIAVNVSARQLEAGDLVERIADLTRLHGIAPADLEIELTESAVMANPEHAAGLFARLRALGVTVAVDDFGTGYSSLAYLRRLPIDILKIDRSFVMAADRDEDDAQIVKTILALGQTLKLTVVAEGIETQGQADLLRALGCDQAQGYLFSRPLPADAIADGLETATPVPAVDQPSP
jgi:diguanylate cyclase (GGDEF)-like protein/PAS domain S-box-containing protein